MKKLDIYLRCLEQQRSNVDEVKQVSYQKDGIEAFYPELTAGGTEKQLADWNELIRKDFNQIIQIYAANPFPELKTSPNEKEIPKLHLEYEIKDNNKVFSVFYKAKYLSPYSAYPTELVYTTNIDKEINKRLRLPNIVKINESFVKEFQKWELAPSKEENAAVKEAIEAYRKNLTSKDLQKGFQAADQIGSSNLWQVYSYLTPDKLGISMYAPNYIGDHIELEQSLTELKEYLKPGIVI